ncbi:MAG: MarR family transcriptional regulator [Halieaceae bacterium]|jgi:DNA-binding MarR family transcriptional regulator|nr:MarR family transcriptional regulator [Halieaceae bacterium]
MNELEDHVLIALRRIIRATDLHSRALGKDTGLTTPQLVVIRAVREMNAPTVSAVARAVSLSQATVTTILKRLEAKGLIKRERSRADRRAVNVQLTAAGRSLWKTAPEPLQYSFTGRFKKLASWEQHSIVAALERVAGMMDAQELDAAPMLASGKDVR